MFRTIKKLVLLIISTPLTRGYCLLLKNQECKVRKVIADNYYMTFPYKIGIDKCIGSCNYKYDPYYTIPILYYTVSILYLILLKILL